MLTGTGSEILSCHIIITSIKIQNCPTVTKNVPEPPLTDECADMLAGRAYKLWSRPVISKSQSSPWATGYLEFTWRLTKEQYVQDAKNLGRCSAELTPSPFIGHQGSGDSPCIMNSPCRLLPGLMGNLGLAMNKKITRSKTCHNGHFAETKICPRCSRDWNRTVFPSNTRQPWVGEDLAGPPGLIKPKSKETEKKCRPLNFGNITE